MELIASPCYSKKENLPKLLDLFPDLVEEDYVIFPGHPYLDRDYIEKNIPCNIVIIEDPFFKTECYDEHPSDDCNYRLIRKNIIELRDNYLYRFDDKLIFVFNARLPDKEDDKESYERVSKILEEYTGQIDYLVSNHMIMKMFIPYIKELRFAEDSLEYKLFKSGFKKWYCYNSGYSMDHKKLFALTDGFFRLE